ncbi:hypothetical protein D9757_008113 [Collybiopsis confluens]|uniref:Phosphoinositide phospholipase C n=1 Tax=Collybiopsis confluens TaxID=2823264 RepID=A0A8H5H6U1_9AGAR|nr:hypothetical protein D9757_008113 [Collybiopsis confluens]
MNVAGHSTIKDETQVHNLTSAPEVLQEWHKFMKVSDTNVKHKLFRIDPEEGRIMYESNNKLKIIPIECIKELRFDGDTSYYRSLYKLPSDIQSRWITIIYILDGKYKILHIIASSDPVFQLWKDSLEKLYAVRQGLMTGTYGNVIRDVVWEKQYWKSADHDGDQRLEFDDVQRLCRSLSLHFSEEELTKLFNTADVHDRGYLDWAAYQEFVKLLKKRPEVETLYQKVSGGKLDFAAFKKFMQESQESNLSDDNLKAIFLLYAGKDDITTSTQPQGAPRELSMGLDEFAAFLRSPDNAATREDHHDMTRPVSEYFISSSHNTYLIGNQLVGVSTIEGYIRALLHSCRTVELDIYDGNEEPQVNKKCPQMLAVTHSRFFKVYHGKTLTSKVSVREICHAIAKYAFHASPYPVVISAEMHCGVKQQDMIVEIMKNTFGSALVSAPIEGREKIKALPSPEALRGKILLKTKNLNISAGKNLTLQPKKAVTATEDNFTSSSSASSASHSSLIDEFKEIKAKIVRKVRDRSKPKQKQMSFSLASLLVYTVGVKCRGIGPNEHYEPEHIFSISENSANKYLRGKTTDLVRHTQTNLIRVYPKGTRLDSSNYEPHLYWAAGAQVVAINWQTFDLGFMINYAMFQRNARAGYVLKPPALRPGNEHLFQKRTKHYLDLTVMSYSEETMELLKDKSGQEIESIVDPLVEVSLHIPIWSHSPFVANEAEVEGAEYSPPTNTTSSRPTTARTVSISTGSVKNNGFNPVWQEELCIPFDCVGDMMDLIFVKFSIKQEKRKAKDEDEDGPIAVYCCSLGSLERGFRYLPLHDSQMSPHLFSTLFVEIKMRDV